MRASPLLISWHNENTPIYSTHFDPHGKGRFATAGGDNNVRLWKIETNGEERKATYLTTLIKHSQAVNVVRFCPKSEMLASAGDDGNILLWVPSDVQTQTTPLGEDMPEDKEIWRVKHMCRSSSGSEIYDLAWSPDGIFFITGSMDNIARIYNAQTGQMVRQIAEHSHYVQGVAWDPLNEFVATQSSDRSVHIYALKTKDGQCTLTAHGKFHKMDLPGRRISSNSPAPPDIGHRSTSSTGNALAVGSPVPSNPGTPMTNPLPMDPPPISHSRRSSFGSSPSIRRSASPAPSLPLPAVRPMEVSSPSLGAMSGLGVKNTNIYQNETFTSFFRRLTFAPDGSLLFTPAGQYKTSHPSVIDPTKLTDEIINTVYIYTRAGFNKPPIAHLPGHRKASVAVKCSPTFYTIRQGQRPTNQITIDTSSAEGALDSLPDPIVPASNGHSSMDPPPPMAHSISATSDPSRSSSSPRPSDSENNSSTPGPFPAFALPYRIVYAVATQDAVLVYDTQQQSPLCVVSNLHLTTFTDLTWSNDGLTLLMSSSDGFCSTLAFAPGELGEPYHGHVPTLQHPTISTSSNTAVSSANSIPLPTPTAAVSPSLAKATPVSTAVTAQPSPAQSMRPTSPTRSNSTSSVATMSSAPVTNNPTPTLGQVPLVTATNSLPPVGLPITTPPQTPSGVSHSATSSVSGSVLGKRDIGHASESEKEDTKEKEPKKRRIAPTPVSVVGEGDGRLGDISD